jgi:alkanesulfonate monooxygenase SsuD/methylene tetrahydromethanopterin reductase-like flavin-dependent oxidoreductase (luciferase family)
MRFGVALNIPEIAGRTDIHVVRDHLYIADLVEPLGFDSLFVLEHHFSGYLLSPSPLQLLSFFAARTQRILLGTAVVVLPWHDPVRLAEEISMLDILCNGRCLFAFGRGRSEKEYRGFRIPISESRARFSEVAEIVVGCLSHESFEYQGRFYELPEISIRPRPYSKPYERFYGVASSIESAQMLSQLGFGLLLSTQKPWDQLADDAVRFQKTLKSGGHLNKPPIMLASISVAKTRDEACERAARYMGEEWIRVNEHYRYSDGRLSMIPGYESYAETESLFKKLHSDNFQSPPTCEYAGLQIVGTPDECARQISELHSNIRFEDLVLEFCYGSMAVEDVVSSMKLCVEEVIPRVRELEFSVRDSARS